MADFDVVVIGGGPAGYAAALKAAELGASVALVEADRPGGQCVHHACIPTNILLGAATAHLEARELGVMGVFEVGNSFNFARAAARKNALVAKMADGIGAALRMRKVTLIEGRASFVGPRSLTISGKDGTASSLSAEAVVIATGTRWEPPAIKGVPAERVLTADAVQTLPVAPASAVVLGDGPADTAFGVEYAVLLAAAGSEVTLVSSRERLLPGFDAALDPVVEGSLGALGIRVFEAASVAGAEVARVTVNHAYGSEIVAAEVIVAADVRQPFYGALNLEAIGVKTAGSIPVDRGCRTNVPGVFAAGDVTGGVMLSSAATQMGEVAAVNATGGEAVTRLGRIPHLLHTVPEVGWVGQTEERARAKGYDVATGLVDLSFNARAIALGAREGVLKLVANRELGEVLGVHVIGPEAGEIVAVAAALMQAEATVLDFASMTHWHPSLGEALAEAARRAL